MKKKYMKPEIAIEVITTGLIMLQISNMGSNETPGGQDELNSGKHRGEWGNLWNI